MQRAFLIIAGLLFGMNVHAQSANDKIVGKWTNEERTRIIEFVKNGNTYDGVVRKAEDERLVGKKQITGLRANGNSSFTNGVVHLFKKGKTATCSVTLSGETKLYLKANYGMMSKTQVWTRL